MTTRDVINPATEQSIATIELLDERRVDEAIARAAAAQVRWAALPPGERAAVLRAASDAVGAANEELARLEVANAGHTIANARWEAGNVRDVLGYYAGAPERLFGRQIPVAGGLDVTFREPVGVVGVIVPWNFPMPIASWGFAPALAAGNAVVLKPADLTPLTAIRIAQLLHQAGLPEDVFQVLPGKGSVVGWRFVTHPLVRKICFTGSTEVGKRIMAGCADQVKRLTLELGGKSANIVFADADLEKAAATAPGSVFDNAGQDCCARSRLLVQASVHDRFLELLEPAVASFRVLDPSDEASQMGPLISAEQRRAVSSFVGEGSPVAFRGEVPAGPGYWFPPTVLAPVDPTSPAVTEEIFGPVLAVVPFEDEADAIRIANDSPYGLSGSLWTRGHRPGAARRPRTRDRDVVGEFALVGPVLDALRRIQAVRPRSGARPGRSRRVHRAEERLHSLRGVIEMGRLENKVAVITGAASGIGRASARRFAAEGARVVVADVADADGAAVADEIGGVFVHADVTDQASVEAMYDEAIGRFGGLDVCFNNAGISPPDDDSILETSMEAWRRVQDVNLTSVYLCCKVGISRLLEHGGGSVINTASFVALLGAATSQISYTASKGGVLSMSRELGVQFARQGVRVNALCPGPVNTPLLRELFAKDPERAARRLVHVPMGRFGEPEEIAAAAAFLASDDASFITASTFLVDGGIHAAYVTPL